MMRFYKNVIKTNTYVFSLVSVVLAATAFAQQQPYPAKPVRLVLGTAPGGGFDITARIISMPLAELLGQQIVIDNRPGAGGGIAATLVANAPADGYTLIMGTVSSHGINPALYKKLAYDHSKDFAPANTPRAVLARLHADLTKVLNGADVRRRLDDQGVDARPSTPEELTAFVRAETQRWQHAVKASGAVVY